MASLAGPVGGIFKKKKKSKQTNKIKTKEIEMLYKHIIYQKFHKKIYYKLNIFVESNKILTNSNKAKSASALVKSSKNHFKNTKINSNLFLSNFLM